MMSCTVVHPELTLVRFIVSNTRVMWLRRTLALAAVLLVALVPAGLALHELEADGRRAGHADCDGCHCLRHLSGIVTDGAPAPTAPGLVVHAVGSPAPDGERGVAICIRPTRGPPA